MTFKIDPELLFPTDLHAYGLEASEARIPPGVIPQSIEVEGPAIGNGRPFNLSYVNEMEMVYMQELGCVKLEVFND